MLESLSNSSHTNQRYSIHGNDWAQKQSSVFASHTNEAMAVLEFGCGDGSILAALDCATKAGIETDSALAQSARAKGLDVRSTVEDFANSTFDQIIVGNELKKLTNPVADLTRLREILAPKGTILLSQPIEAGGKMQTPAETRKTMQVLRETLVAAGYVVNEVAIKRSSYRSAGFKFRNDESTSSDTRKTYWMVKPFLSLIAVAQKAT